MNSQEDKERFLIRISELYYNEELGQQEIADMFHISRPHISRLLSTAKKQGIVNISIRNPYAYEQKLERVLKAQFNIKDIYVTGPGKVGEEGARYLERNLIDNDIISIMGGKTVWSVCVNAACYSRKGLFFVPAIGGWGNTGSNWHANLNTQTLAENLHGDYYVLNAPSVVATTEARDMFLAEKEISLVLDLARQSKYLLMSIGQISDKATMVQTGVYSKDDFFELQQNGAVASLCSWFIDKNGECVDFPAKERLIGLNAEEIRKIPNVIAVADGEDKAEAIAAALEGKWIDVLITDSAAAQRIIDL